MELEKEIKQKKFRNDYHKAFINLCYTQCFIYSKFASVLNLIGITPQQYNILRILRGQSSGFACIGLIKERMLDKNSDVTRILKRMCLKKIVIRKICPHDRRQMEVRITPIGRKLLSKIDAVEQKMDNILSRLSKNEIHGLNKLLDMIRD